MTTLTNQGDMTPSADDLIRSVMTEQKREVSRQVLPELEPTAPHESLSYTQNPTAKAAKPARETSSKGGVLARIKAYRPTRKHIILTALALVVFFRPWLIPGLLFVTFWVGLIAYLTLGPDRTGEKLRGVWDWLVRTRPATAEKLRGIADSFALKFDALLDRLPDHWAEKLALPDLSNAPKDVLGLDEAPDPFDRLKKLPEVYRG